MSERFYLTTPLYYVNDEPHIGHAYTTVLADVIARYHRLFGDEVHLLTGTDEHGQKVADAAKKLGREPQEHCDITAQRFVNVWDKLTISHDDFIRTTQPRHVQVVQEVLNRLNEKGDIYRETYTGWYSVHEERFFTEKDLVDGKDPIGGKPVEKIEEDNYFFRMSNYQQWLIDHYEANPDAVLPSFRLNEVKGFLRQPLGDLCISRPKSRLAWGIEIPWDPDYVTYVWFDALLNYYSATVNPPEGTSPLWPADYHLIGKDILTTHAVYWPIMLHAAGLEPPRHILAHGWWIAKDRAKMSKSAGNVVRPLDLADIYGPDLFRYFLMRDMVVGQDAAFSEEGLVKRLNSDLANDLGNLLNRITKLIQQHFDGTVPAVERSEEDELVELAESTAHKVRTLVEELQIHSAIEETLQLVRFINRDITEAEPWKTAKTDKAAAGRALARAAEGLRIAATLLVPVMPERAAAVLERLGAAPEKAPSWDRTAWGSGLEGSRVVHGDPLFPRHKVPASSEIEDTARGKQEAKQTGQEQKKQPRSEPAGEDGIIEFDQFMQVELVTATVLEAEPVEESDKLMKLQIDLGSEQRQLVAGIKQHVSAEELVGRSIVVVKNLKPRKIFGLMSQGMLLAARQGDDLRLLSAGEGTEPGVRIS